MTPEKWRFGLGVVLATPAALSLLSRRDLEGLLDRHAGGDWGDFCRSDARANDHGLGHGGRLLSAYVTPPGRVWIITEEDRSYTTVLLPEEY